MIHFKCRGKWFKVNDKGYMTQENNNDFSGRWHFLGVSFHHWRNGIDLNAKEIIGMADSNLHYVIGGLVWDKDHGVTRQWGGQYCGKLPRITAICRILV